jgi:hypothetical protein
MIHSPHMLAGISWGSLHRIHAFVLVCLRFSKKKRRDEKNSKIMGQNGIEDSNDVVSFVDPCDL